MGRLLSWILNLFAQDASPAVDACEICRELHCTNEQAATCAIRLAAIDSAKGGAK